MVALPALVLLHGIADSGECWTPFVSALDLPDAKIVTPDAPGHGGRRVSPGQDITAPDMVAAAVAVAEPLAASSPAGVVIGGHSMGAAVALTVAAQRPDLVRGLFLEDPPLWEPASDLGREERDVPVEFTDIYNWVSGLQRGSLEAAVEHAHADHPHWAPAEYGPWARAKLALDVETLREPKIWPVAGWTARARAVRCPSLVLAGEVTRGSIVDPEAETFLRSLPGWRVERIPGAGHDVRRDGRAAALELLRHFITGLAR